MYYSLDTSKYNETKTDNSTLKDQCPNEQMFDCLQFYGFEHFILNNDVRYSEFDFGNGHWYPVIDDCYNDYPYYIYGSNFCISE